MSTIDASIVVGGGGLAIVMWWLLYRTFRGYACSMFRYKLWRIRDDLVDACFSGKMPSENPAVEQLILSIEAAIRRAPYISFIGWLVLPKASEESVHEFRSTVTSGLDQMNPDQREFFHECMRRFVVGALLTYLVRGSVSGLISLGIVTVGKKLSDTRQAATKCVDNLVGPEKFLRLAEATNGLKTPLSKCC